MDYGFYPYDEPYARPRRRINYFAWTITILLLTGFALAAWLGSFYIFNQPERPDSYRILQRLHKIEPPKRFELTAAPAGEFLSAKQLYERYSEMGNAELARANAELARNYIRNYQTVRGLVPYVVGRFKIVAARELGPGDVFTSGMVALTNAIDNGELLMEHLYPANPEAVPLMKQTLSPGLEIKLERTHDISAVIHAERLADGRIMVTAVPLLYGSYTVTRGTGSFRLEPPLSLNLAAGWPLFKGQERRGVEEHYRESQQMTAVAQGSPVSIPGFSPSATPPPARNELVRVEQARPVSGSAPPLPVIAKNENLAKATPPPKEKRGKKQQLESPPPASSPAQPIVAQKPIAPTGTPMTVASAVTPSNIAVATPAPAAKSSEAEARPVAQAQSVQLQRQYRFFPLNQFRPTLPTLLWPQMPVAAVGKHFRPARCLLAG